MPITVPHPEPGPDEPRDRVEELRQQYATETRRADRRFYWKITLSLLMFAAGIACFTIAIVTALGGGR